MSDITEQDVKRLEAAAERAQKTLRKLISKKDHEEYKRVAAARDAITKELAEKYDADIARLADAAHAAEVARDQALQRRAMQGIGAPYPIGTKMLHWERVRSRNNFLAHEWVLSGKRGKVEVFMRDSSYGGSEYEKPKPGDIIIRLVKKDGSPGLRCLKIHSYAARHWYPEGQKPKEDA